MEKYQRKFSQDYSFDSNKISSLLIPALILLIIRVIAFFILAGLCIIIGIDDVTHTGGFFQGIYVWAFISALILGVFTFLDVLGVVKLIKNQRSGKILPLFSSLIIVISFALMIIFEPEANILIVPIIYNIAIIILCAKVRLSPMQYSVPLAQPIFEENYSHLKEYNYQKPETPEIQNPELENKS